MLELTHFSSQHWVITPAALALTEATPPSISDQKWLLVLTGIAATEFTQRGTAFEHSPPTQTLRFVPEIKEPCDYVIGRYGLPKPPGDEGLQYRLGFELENWSLFVTFAHTRNLDADWDQFAIRRWRASPFRYGTDILSQREVTRIFDGVEVDFTVANQNTRWYGISYNITLLGRIVFPGIVIT
jgi:hypothetical protein